MEDLSKLLQWKLLKGSHEFPGPDGGTCINEAALVVAGFDYRSVSSAEDLPPCFSRPIAAHAIALNDTMGDKARQRLIPFAVRLAGSADTPDVEFRRMQLIVLRTIREIVAPAFDRIGLHDAALKLRHTDWDSLQKDAADAAKKAAYAAKKAADAADAAYAAKKAADAAKKAAYAAYAAYAAKKAADAADAADAAYAAYAAYAAERKEIEDIQISILDEALSIGQQAEPIEHALIAERVAQAKERARREHASA